MVDLSSLAPPGRVLSACLFAAGLAACDGVVPEVGVSGPGGLEGSTEAAGGARPDPGYDSDDLGAKDRPGPSTRAARLSHAQWANTVRDLLGIDDIDDQLSRLRSDPRQSGFLFDNLATALSVDEALLRGYERAAQELAEQVAADPAFVAEWAPEADGDLEARRDDFIARFGLRAHRRPLTTDQQAAYAALFDLAPELYSGLGALEAGVRAVVEAVLQSPYFLYRFEQSQQVEGEVVPLDDYEVASRLSYFLWNTMPDQALFEAALDGELTDPRVAAEHAARMLADPRGEQTLVRFHGQLYETERYDTIDPAASLYSGTGDLGELARTEQELFVVDTLSVREGSYADLLTSPRTFVDADLATLYGLEGDFGADFEPVSLDPNERAGVFTQVGFLALHASALYPDPIHRGAFLARRIACLTVAAPPDQIPPLPDPEGRTNRQRVEDHTEQPGSTCAGCHAALINPFGFPFEGYDAAGAFRTEDLGMPIDAASAPLLDGEQTPVDDAVALAASMAQSESVHRCYAQRWVEFAYGREVGVDDDPLLERLAHASLVEDSAVVDLIVGMVRSEAFLTRSEQELP